MASIIGFQGSKQYSFSQSVNYSFEYLQDFSLDLKAEQCKYFKRLKLINNQLKRSKSLKIIRHSTKSTPKSDHNNQSFQNLSKKHSSEKSSGDSKEIIDEIQLLPKDSEIITDRNFGKRSSFQLNHLQNQQKSIIIEEENKQEQSINQNQAKSPQIQRKKMPSLYKQTLKNFLIKSQLNQQQQQFVNGQSITQNQISSTDFQTDEQTRYELSNFNEEFNKINSLSEMANIFSYNSFQNWHNQFSQQFGGISFQNPIEENISSLSNLDAAYNINHSKISSPSYQSQSSSPSGSYSFSSQDILALSNDQTGCRKLQKLLDTNDQAQINCIFEQLIPTFNKLAIDQYGNYLSQKVAEKCNSEQFLIILKQLKHDIILISLNPHGTRVIQKLIEIITTKYIPYSNSEQVITNFQLYQKMKKKLTKALQGNVLTLSQDPNGNRVLEKCLLSFTQEENDYLYEEMIKNYYYICTHIKGCCIMQQFLELNHPKNDKLIQLILQHLEIFLNDKYANYVIDCILQKTNFEQYKLYIANVLMKDFLYYSKQLHTSKLIEKCITLQIGNCRALSIQLLINQNIIAILLTDPYGNYVVQTCLKIANTDEKSLLLNEIIKNQKQIKSTALGVKIWQKLENDYQLSNYINYQTFMNEQLFYQSQHLNQQNYLYTPAYNCMNTHLNSYQNINVQQMSPQISSMQDFRITDQQQPSIQNFNMNYHQLQDFIPSYQEVSYQLSPFAPQRQQQQQYQQQQQQYHQQQQQQSMQFQEQLGGFDVNENLNQMIDNLNLNEGSSVQDLNQIDSGKKDAKQKQQKFQ